MTNKIKISNSETGFIAFVSVLVVSAVVLAIGISVTLLSIGEGQTGLAQFKGEDTLSFVESCMEDALLNSRSSNTYAGGNITRPEGTCTVVVSKTSNVWTITTSTSATVYKRSIQTVVTRNGYGITLTSWKEI